MPLRRPVTCLAALAIAVAGLAGCGSSDDADPTMPGSVKSAAPSTSSKLPDESSWKASGPTQMWEASGSAVTFRAAVPAGWETGTQGSTSGVRSPKEYRGFRANALIRFEDAPEGTSIEDLAASVKSDVTAMAGWKSSAPEGSRGTFDGNSAFRISGTHTEAGTSMPLALTEIVLLVEGPSGPVAVYITYTTHAGDTESHNAVEEMLGTMTFDH